MNLKENTTEKIASGTQAQTTPSHNEVITIRKAVKQDCGRMLELIKELATYERALHEVTVTYDHFEESGFGDKPVWWALAAEIDNVVQGFAMYFVRYRTWKGQYMFLEDFIVTEQFRGKGIGKLLFDKLIEEAKEKGFKGMVWQVLDWNEPAINFYKKYDGVSFNKEWIDCTLQFDSREETGSTFVNLQIT